MSETPAEEGEAASPCQEQLTAASICVRTVGTPAAPATTAPCRSCWDAATFEDDFPATLSGEFMGTMATAMPTDPNFCNQATSNVCTFLKGNEDCCCIEEQQVFAGCYVDQVLAVSVGATCAARGENEPLCGGGDADGGDAANLSGGMLAGITIIFVLAVILAIQIYLRRKRRLQKQARISDSTEGDLENAQLDKIQDKGSGDQASAEATGWTSKIKQLFQSKRQQGDNDDVGSHHMTLDITLDEEASPTPKDNSDDDSSSNESSDAEGDSLPGAAAGAANGTQSMKRVPSKMEDESDSSSDDESTFFDDGSASSASSTTVSVNTFSERYKVKTPGTTAARPRRGKQGGRQNKADDATTSSGSSGSSSSKYTLSSSEESSFSMSSFGTGQSLLSKSKSTASKKSTTRKTRGKHSTPEFEEESSSSEDSDSDTEGGSSKPSDLHKRAKDINMSFTNGNEKDKHKNEYYKKKEHHHHDNMNKSDRHKPKKRHSHSSDSTTTTTTSTSTSSIELEERSREHLRHSELKYLLKRRTEISKHLEQFCGSLPEHEKWKREKLKVGRRIAELMQEEEEDPQHNGYSLPVHKKKKNSSLRNFQFHDMNNALVNTSSAKVNDICNSWHHDTLRWISEKTRQANGYGGH